MPTRLQAFGAALMAAACSVASCSIEPAPPVPGQSGSDTGGSSPSEGGTGSDAGKGGKPSSNGGKGGKGGSAGRAGSGGAGTGGAGTGGEIESQAGAGGEPPEPCPGCESGFCLGDGTCVECLAENDQCPAGHYCTDANVCAEGCKDAASCASGSCGADHNCERCISDDECTGDLLCNSGKCGAACGAADEGQQASCETGLTCCSQHCKDVAVASDHCGACGAACEAGQFCGLASCTGGGDPSACVACHDVALANLCAIAKAIVILDSNKNPDEGNRAPGRAVGAALGAQCQPQPVVTEEEQDSVSALNFTTGRPVSGGGELLLVAGGFFYQNLEGYVEQQGISPLYVKVEDSRQQLMRRSDDSIVARDTNTSAEETESHDFFALQFMRDPASGSLVLNFQGFWLSGTEAAAFFMMNGVLADLAAFDRAWYVYEWTDQNGDRQPDLSEIDLYASGP